MMMFISEGRRFEFEIPDEWWSAAGMSGFTPRSSTYFASAHPTLATRVLAIDQIRAFRHAPSVTDFDRDRMLSVLDAIRRHQVLPPIEVDRFTHRLHDGLHRFHASIAAGFSHVPAAIGSFI
jgi:hypothetical protein